MLRARVLIPFMIATVIWGSTWIVIRGQLGVVPPTWSVAYRFLAGAIAMILYARWQGQTLRLSPREYGFAALLGVAQFVVNFNCVYRAEQYVTSGLVAVLFALLLVPNTLLGAIFLKQAVRGRFLIGSLLALGGVGLLILRELRVDESDSRATMFGVVLSLVAVLAASVANVMQATSTARAMPMAAVLAWAMLAGSGANALIALVTVGWPVLDPSPTYVLGVLYLGVFASAIAFTCYFSVIRDVGPARAAYSSVLTPILAMGLSTMFEGYRWTWLAAGGGVLVLIGLMVALSARRPVTKSG